MEINKHISFLMHDNPKLFAYLEEHSIFYKQVYQSCVFDMLESNPHWGNVNALLKKGNVVCLSDTIYTKKELSDAQWLTVRSVWKFGYPQPEGGEGYEAATYSLDGYCSDCGSGLVQKSGFRMKKAPKWGKRHFMMLNWVGDELFVDDVAKTLLSQSNLSGFSFREVYNKNGTEILDGVYQIYIQKTLPNGLLTNTQYIDKVEQCHNCGITKYHSTGIGNCVFQKEIFEGAPDIVKSKEMFGWEYWMQKEIIVSQQFYQFIIQNNLGNALEFRPIELINKTGDGSLS